MTQYIQGNLTLDGLDANDRIHLMSTTGSFVLSPQSSQAVSFLVVQDSQTERSDITATTSVEMGTDSGDPSPHWIFSEARYWVGATNPANTNLMSSWGTTSGACGTGGASIPTSTNDVIFDGVCDNNATVDAAFTIASLDIQSGYTGTIAPNAAILIDVEGGYTQVAGTLDLQTNNTNMNVGGNFLKTGGVLLTGTGNITLDGISTLKSDSGANLGNVVASPPGAGTVTLESDVLMDDLIITTADQLNADGYEITTIDDVTINGTLDISNGTDGISTVNIGGGWDATGGMFTQGNAVLTFTSTNTEAITSGGNSFSNITFNGNGGIWILQDDMDLNSGVTLTNGTLDANVSGNHLINISGNWVETTGTFVPRMGTVIFDQASGTQTISADASFYNFVIDDPDGGSDLTLRPSGTLDINGTFLQQDSTFDLATNNAGMLVAGNFTLTSGAFSPPVTTIIFDGDKTFFDGIVTTVGTILIDPDTTLTSDFTCTSLTVNSGDTFTTDGYEIDCSRDITVNGTLDARPGTDGNTIVNLGEDWNSSSGLILMASSTVIFDDTAGNNAITTGSNSFYNFVLEDGNGGSNVGWNLGDNLDVNGTLWIINGDLDVTTSNYQVNVAGNWMNNDEFMERSGNGYF